MVGEVGNAAGLVDDRFHRAADPARGAGVAVLRFPDRFVKGELAELGKIQNDLTSFSYKKYTLVIVGLL